LIRHPIFIIAVAGILIRLIMLPITEVGFDSDYWATIIRNLNSGEGLYGLEGYYYTPVWGYFLSFMSAVQSLFTNIDVMGLRIPAAFSVETYKDWFFSATFSATITSVKFNFFIKIPFLISDLIVGYLIYWLIKDKTGDMKKATYGFALWFLCPLVICVTSISGMFDTFSVMFTLLCIVMVRKDKLFLAGVLFSFAILTKFFPVYLLFIILAYIIVRHRDDGTAVKAIIKAAAGALLAFIIIMLPQIIGGDLAESMSFISTRVGGNTETLFDVMREYGAVMLYAVSIPVSILLGYMLTKKSKDDLDRSFIKYALFIIAFIFLYPPTPQYLVLLVPFLAIFIVTRDSKFKWSWILVSLGGTIFLLASSFTLLMSLGEFTNIVSVDYLVSMIQWAQSSGSLGIPPMYLVYIIGGVIEYVGILSVVVLILKEKYIDRLKCTGSADTEAVEK
jgi:hypothetical protein